ncbi:MAG: hypothetical protein U0930_06125 [Pirellulales bacterium]
MNNSQSANKKRPPSQIVRVVTNYARLLGALLIGFLLVRILLRFGEGAFGLITLLGSGTGLGMIIQETVRAGTVPILGKAYHSGSAERFRAVLSSAMAASLIASIAVVAIYAALYFCVPLFKIPEALWASAQWFTIAMGLMSVFNVALSPLINFFAVSERMALYNFSGFLLRLADLLAASITLFAVSIEEPAMCIIVYGWVYTVIAALTMLITSALAFKTDRIVSLSFRSINRSDMASFAHSAGWNSGVTLALSLYSKTNTIIYNLFFGIFGNVVFGIANQLTFYVRQTVSGLVHGMDAVSARITNTDSPEAIKRLLNRSTHHQSIIVMPASAGLVLFTHWIVNFWVGDRLDDPAKSLPVISMLICILVAGVAARALSDGWIKIMSGDGSVSSYAPWVIAGGLCNPVLAILATWLAPESIKLYCAAYVFSSLTVLVHLVVIPRIISRRYSLPLSEVYSPFLKPGLATGIATVLTLLAMKLASETALVILISPVAFVICYSIQCLMYVFTADERTRILRLLRLQRFAGSASNVALTKPDNG